MIAFLLPNFLMSVCLYLNQLIALLKAKQLGQKCYLISWNITKDFTSTRQVIGVWCISKLIRLQYLSSVTSSKYSLALSVLYLPYKYKKNGKMSFLVLILNRYVDIWYYLRNETLHKLKDKNKFSLLNLILFQEHQSSDIFSKF